MPFVNIKGEIQVCAFIAIFVSVRCSNVPVRIACGKEQNLINIFLLTLTNQRDKPDRPSVNTIF